MKTNSKMNMSDWKTYCFEDLFEEINIKNKDGNEYPVLSVTQGRGIVLQSDKYKKEIASENKTGYKCVPKKSIVFNPNYLNFGAIGVQEVVEIGLVSSIYGVFKIRNTDLLDYDFVKYLIRTPMLIKEYNKFANGSSAIVLTGELHGMHVRLSVSIKDFKKITWKFPPLKEQRRIAELLLAFDRKINNAIQLSDKAKELKKGLMQQLLTKGIGHTEFKQTELGEIPVDWEEKTIGELFKFEGGSQPPRNTFVFEERDGYIRLIQIRDYKTDKYQTYIPLDLAKRFCTKDDIMIGRYGPPVFQILRGIEGSYNVALIKAIPNEKLDKEYAYYYLCTERLFNLIDKLSQRTSGQTGVDMEALRAYPLPLPSIKEQQKIAQILSTVDEQIEVYEQEKAKYEELKKGLMQQLLTGQIRVKI